MACRRNDNYLETLSSSSSSAASLQLPKSFENVNNAHEIWKIIRKRFPKTAPLLNELEQAIDRAQGRVQSLNYQGSSVISRTLIDENELSPLLRRRRQEDSTTDDLTENKSLKEWEGFGNSNDCDYPKNTAGTNSALTIEEATNQIKKVQIHSELVESNNFRDTISTIAVVKRCVEQESHHFHQPTITTKEAFFAPAQERISSCPPSPSFNNNEGGEISATVLSPRGKISEKKSPSRIPKKTPRGGIHTPSPKSIDLHQDNNKSPSNSAREKKYKTTTKAAFSRFSKTN